MAFGAHQILFAGEGTCLTEAIQLQLSTLDEAARSRFVQVCTVSVFKESLTRDVALAAVYLLGLGLFIAAGGTSRGTPSRSGPGVGGGCSRPAPWWP